MTAAYRIHSVAKILFFDKFSRITKRRITHYLHPVFSIGEKGQPDNIQYIDVMIVDRNVIGKRVRPYIFKPAILTRDATGHATEIGAVQDEIAEIFSRSIFYPDQYLIRIGSGFHGIFYTATQ